MWPLIATICGILLGRLLPAALLLWLEFSIYWIFMVMVLDYGIKAVLVLHRYRSRKWMQLRMA